MHRAVHDCTWLVFCVAGWQPFSNAERSQLKSGYLWHSAFIYIYAFCIRLYPKLIFVNCQLVHGQSPREQLGVKCLAQGHNVHPRIFNVYCSYYIVQIHIRRSKKKKISFDERWWWVLFGTMTLSRLQIKLVQNWPPCLHTDCSVSVALLAYSRTLSLNFTDLH